MKDFGSKVKRLRQERNMSREDFCEDETELSVRQLARIETGVSLPTLNKVYYIASRLNVTVGELTEGNNFDVPERYKELKHAILRVPTYSEPERLKKREEQYDEIYNDYYDSLPEEEKMVVDSVRARLDVSMGGNANFGVGLLEEYFEQVKLKKSYSLNDLILIDLYLTCIMVDTSLYQEEEFLGVLNKVIPLATTALGEEAFFVGHILTGSIYVLVQSQKTDIVEELITLQQELMQRTQDFQRLPILRLVEWKYCLFCLSDKQRAESSFREAVMFAKMIGDTVLASNLEMEWQKDNRK